MTPSSNSANKISILITEDQTLMRQGIKALLDDNDKMHVIGESANGRECLDFLKTLQPDIVLLDIDMPIMNGREALEIITRRYPNVKVIMLSMHNEVTIMSDFIALGARAYLEKGCDIDLFIKTIETVYTKGRYLTEAVTEALLRDFKREKSGNVLFGELALTPREIEVLKGLCNGKKNKDIAKELKISVSTVDFHRGNIYIKSKCKGISELMKMALKNGFIKI